MVVGLGLAGCTLSPTQREATQVGAPSPRTAADRMRPCHREIVRESRPEPPPAVAYAISPDGLRTAAVHRWTAVVQVTRLTDGSSWRFSAIREPVACAFGLAGRVLVVANLLPAARTPLDDDNPNLAAEITLIEPEAAEPVFHIPLPDGSHSLRGLAISPDGRFAVVTHLVANYHVPTWSADRGGINRNAISLISLEERSRWLTLGLDDEYRGAANPWAVAFDPHGRRLYVTHAGTHELTLLEWPRLLDVAARTRGADEARPAAAPGRWREFGRRIALPVRGPRSICITERHVIVTGEFDRAVAAMDVANPDRPPRRLRLGRWPPDDLARLGEFYFHDASSGTGRWHSCASCHPDGRDDGLYWDLLNDGVGNPKNTKSLLLSPMTPPAMWRGVRGDASSAIRAGIEHMIEGPAGEDRVAAIEAYLRSLRPVPSPALDRTRPLSITAEDPDCHLGRDPAQPRGVLSEAARRGRELFRGKAGCIECHPPPWYTAMRPADPGLGSGIEYDIPTLIEVWRTAPYLHDGSAPTLREAIHDFNPLQRRGRTADLTDQELDDLVEYVQSL